MMEAAPSASLVVPEADLLLEFLIVALDAPAHLGNIDEAAEADLRRLGGEPVFGRRGFALGPLDQQPLLLDQVGDRSIVSDAHAHPRKA